MVRYNRLASGGTCVLFAGVLVAAVQRTSGAATLLLVLASFVPLTILAAYHALFAKPVLVITGAGIVMRGQNPLRWADIERIVIRDSRGFAGIEQYELVLDLAPNAPRRPARRFAGFSNEDKDNPITVPLDLLTPSWPEIAQAIHERSGTLPIIPRRFMPTALDT